MLVAGIILIASSLLVLGLAALLFERTRELRLDASRSQIEALRIAERLVQEAGVRAFEERRDLTSRHMHLLNRTYDLPPQRDAPAPARAERTSVVTDLENLIDPLGYADRVEAAYVVDDTL